jgi:hypothetical protein
LIGIPGHHMAKSGQMPRRIALSECFRQIFKLISLKNGVNGFIDTTSPTD